MEYSTWIRPPSSGRSRSFHTLAALHDRGLIVESLKGDFAVRPAAATDDPARVGPVDAVILAVKAWQVPEAAESTQSLGTAENHAILPLLIVNTREFGLIFFYLGIEESDIFFAR